MNAVVTGAGGFIGRHVVEALRRRPGVSRVVGIRRETPGVSLDTALRSADVVFHLAGVNRPQDPAEFERGNRDFTTELCRRIEAGGMRPLLILASSSQADLDNPYGRSKRAAETEVEQWAGRGGGSAVIFRIRNVFGKWCRPNYNSVTATFCHNVARGLPLVVSDANRALELVYIDDVVSALLATLDGKRVPIQRREIVPVYATTLGRLADLIRSFRESRSSLVLPSFEDDFTRRLYATYLSYLDGVDFSYALHQRTDERGTLAEVLKSAPFGQIFVSRTKPGITRGNHYHHTKTEKFLVVEGDAIVRFCHIGGGDVIEHRVNGQEFRVVDIPPGFTHSIQNIGERELVTLFWASEIFDPQRPDTHMLPVLTQSA